MSSKHRYHPSSNPIEDRRRKARAILDGARGKLSRAESDELYAIVNGHEPTTKAETAAGEIAFSEKTFDRLCTEFSHLLR